MGTLNNTKRRWYVSLEQHPTITVARLVHQSPAAGTQIWDECPWPLPIGGLTETGILSELYDATLDFWSKRA